MLNLIPVVVFLLMQGVGGESLTLRQQQALLDLAQRTHSVQGQREIGEALAQRGVKASEIALLFQLFASVKDEQAREPFELERSSTYEAPKNDTCDGQSEAANPRDGPVTL